MGVFQARKSDDAPTDMTIRRWVILTVAMLVLIVGFHFSPALEFMDTMVARRAEFSARLALGHSPALSPKLKIIAFDDHSLSTIHRREVSLSEWASLLRAIDERHPRAILIDKIFQVFPPNDRGLPALLDAVSRRVGVGSFTFPETLPGYEPISLQDKHCDLGPFIAPGNRLDQYGWLPQQAEGVKIYGPQQPVATAVHAIGHLMHVGQGLAYPVLLFGERTGLFHLGLRAANEKIFSEGRLRVDGAEVPVDAHGRMAINLVAKRDFFKHTVRWSRVWETMQSGQPLAFIDPDDVVVILPEMFTGSTDFKDTPIGRVAGGFFPVSVANSVLTGQWLSWWHYNLAMLVLVCLIGAVIGWRLSAAWFWTSITLLTATVVAGGLGGFVLHGMIMSWMLPACGGLLCGAVVFLERSRMELRRTVRLRHALEDLVSPEKLEVILRDRDAQKFEASERDLSVMFIDIVGFSAMAETRPAREIFRYLTDTMSQLADKILAHGGVIDRTMGDGILCFFGHSFGTAEQGANHAEAALQCALDIQRSHAQRILEARAEKLPVFPLRIGINTATVLVGDIGGGRRRVDFTIVGHGVNFAKRLETACALFQVMIGPATYDRLPPEVRQWKSLRSKLFGAKHHEELLSAWECSLFDDNPNQLVELMATYRESAGIMRDEYRWFVPKDVQIGLRLPFGTGHMTNFSLGGFAMEIGQYLAPGVGVRIDIEGINDEFRASARERGVLPLLGEVRWSRASGGKFLHGVSITNISSEQQEFLLAGLREACREKESIPS